MVLLLFSDSSRTLLGQSDEESVVAHSFLAPIARGPDLAVVGRDRALPLHLHYRCSSTHIVRAIHIRDRGLHPTHGD